MKKLISIFVSFLMLASMISVCAEPAVFTVSEIGTSILEFEDYASDFPLPVRMGKDIKPENEASGGDYIYVVSYKMDVADLAVPVTVERDGYYDAVFTATKGSWLSDIQIFADNEESPFFTVSTANGTLLDSGDEYFYHLNNTGGRDFPGVRFPFTMYLSEGSHTLTFRFFGREAFNNTIAFCMDSLALTPSAQSGFFMKLSGNTDREAKGATVMMVKKGADRGALNPSDVLYIDQSDIQDDGSFEMVLPFLGNVAYDMYSNMDDFDIDSHELKKIYISENGNDENDGSENAPYKTFAKAYSDLGENIHIVISGTVPFTDAPEKYSRTLFVSGTDGATLALPAQISLQGGLSLSNLNTSGESQIFANGKEFTVEKTVTSTDRLKVVGGTKGTDLYSDTYLSLSGGRYSRVYGGCEGNGVLYGNTHLMLGGNANAGDGMNDKASNYSPCHIFGGGNGSTVAGETNVTLTGNAVVSTIYGAGAAATATKTNITIEGGKVQNVFGGAWGGTISDCETNITMQGGLAESLFGGSEAHPMTNSHTRVYLLGGEVTRRVYSGCYNASKNDTALSTTHAVGGSTTLILGPDAKVNTKTELHADNLTDIGIYAGSRLQSENANEKNMIIYTEDCADKYSGAFGPLDDAAKKLGVKSFPHYTVTVIGGNGSVIPGKGAGVVRLIPDNGYAAKINEDFPTSNITTVPQTATITFEKSHVINSVTASVTDHGVETDVEVFINSNIIMSPWILVAIYDENNLMVDCQTLDIINDSFSAYFEFDCELEAGKPYTLKAMLWNNNMQPLTSEYQIQIQK